MVTSGANMRFECQRSRSLGRKKRENRFSRISTWKVDRFTSNQDQNDRRVALNISSNTLYQQNCEIFTILVYLSACHVSSFVQNCGNL